MADETQDPAVYRVKEAFAVPAADGFPRTYAVGKLLSGGDPLATSHRALLEPVANAVEKVTVELATAEPGGRRRRLRLPSGVDLTQATEPHTGSAHPKETPMVHTLPPEDPNSPASAFATEQPGLGVVADDAADQNPGGGPLASEVADSSAVAEVAKAAAKAKSK